MLFNVVSLAVLATTVSSLALPDPQTTGPSGGQPIYATSTNITYYQGVTAGSGSTSTDINECGTYVGDGTIIAGKCTPFKTQGVGIWGSVNGSCSLALYRGSDTCGGTPDIIRVPNGEDNITCVATGVMDGGVHYHGSGIWMCG